MYQYSLDWCGGIYMNSIDNSEKFDNIATRINEIKTHFTFNLFENICQGLLDDDKWLFAFLLATNTLRVDEEQFMTFLKLPVLKYKGGGEAEQRMHVEKAAEM